MATDVDDPSFLKLDFSDSTQKEEAAEMDYVRPPKGNYLHFF